MPAFEIVRAAQQVLAELRKRNDIFGAAQDGFGEPAWEMLLHLVVDEAKRPTMPAAELMERVDIVDAFGRIYIKWMEMRVLATHDEAADCVQLTDLGRGKMTAYLWNVKVAA